MPHHIATSSSYPTHTHHLYTKEEILDLLVTYEPLFSDLHNRLGTEIAFQAYVQGCYGDYIKLRITVKHRLKQDSLKMTIHMKRTCIPMAHSDELFTRILHEIYCGDQKFDTKDLPINQCTCTNSYEQPPVVASFKCHTVRTNDTTTSPVYLGHIIEEFPIPIAPEQWVHEYYHPAMGDHNYI